MKNYESSGRRLSTEILNRSQLIFVMFFSLLIIFTQQANANPTLDFEDKTEKNIAFEVSGIVKDENGKTIPGVAILEKGTSNGVVTDFNGNFKISVTDENSVLIFSYVGFIT